MDSSRPLNLIEQINQTFTYLASFLGAKILFNKHSGLENINLNLGTQSGSDIESNFDGGIAAEVFSSVSPSNNNKLSNDIKKVGKIEDRHKYVFFLCPDIKEGIYTNPFGNEVYVYSLGDYEL
ncbi:hypothetical protein MTBBW1_1720005 [Desulfamplus magnetovallimortis]|uniref:Uncharacterized protein n=1 Tax=Desulfamplus magnetovallimortis TaxID=1246637 RepID=A0A1W1H9X9_9BACT|nr:hypothetical protein [Desulfamplus magnetovallimortis]SLM29188.1 hypothetical protein MTBBW1_1720005 [Desulfamplus magnetovallimortis]